MEIGIEDRLAGTRSSARRGQASGRAGALYLFDNGLAPYLSYSESFQPLGGVDFYGTPFKPQRGQQWEAGVKWQPEGRGISAYAALYQLREKNRKTTDPANPRNNLQIGETKARGLEAELTASIARSWDADAGLRLHRRRDLAQQRGRRGAAGGRRAEAHGLRLAVAPLRHRRPWPVDGGRRIALHGLAMDGHDRHHDARLHHRRCHGGVRRGRLAAGLQRGEPDGQGADHAVPGTR